jgi:UDP-N-acetyl-D-glucosamine dehydrogenase
MYKNIINRIKAKQFSVGIIGLGYVGLPLAIKFINNNVKVYGIDNDKKKILSLRKGISYIKSISDHKILYFKKNQNFIDWNYKILSAVDVIIICLPTPLKKNKDPDLSYIFDCLNNLFFYLKKDQTLILESTVYPGVSLKIKKILEKKFKVGHDFYLGYSPERENPGDKKFSYKITPKVISGYSKKCLSIMKLIYSIVVKKTVPVSSMEVAETSKLLENLYRAVNIGLVNELKIICHHLKIDVFEVIEAAATKNFGFQRFDPGPGLGGHCIPIDPYYLSWISKKKGYDPRFIKTSGYINHYVTKWVVRNVLISAINKKSFRLLILGISYKKNIDDDRESPAYEIMNILIKKKINFDYNDPFFKYIRIGRNINLKKKSINLNKKNLRKYTAVLIVTDHDSYNYKFISENSDVIYDTRGVFRAKKLKKCNNIVFI